LSDDLKTHNAATFVPEAELQKMRSIFERQHIFNLESTELQEAARQQQSTSYQDVELQMAFRQQQRKLNLNANVARYKTGLMIDKLRAHFKTRDAPNEVNLALLRKLEEIESEHEADNKRMEKEKTRRQNELGYLQNRTQKLEGICSTIMVAMRVVSNFHNADPSTMIKAFPLLAALAEQDAALIALIDAGIHKSVADLLILYRAVPGVQAYGCSLLAVMMGGGERQIKTPVRKGFLHRMVAISRHVLPMVLSAMSVHPTDPKVQVAACEALFAMAQGRVLTCALLFDKHELIVRRLLDVLTNHADDETVVQLSTGTLLSLAMFLYPHTFNDVIIDQEGWEKIRECLERYPSKSILRYGSFKALLDLKGDRVTLRASVPRRSRRKEGKEPYKVPWAKRIASANTCLQSR